MKKILLLSVLSLALFPLLTHAATNRLAGKFLLQVESRGEVWYVNPADNARYQVGTNDGFYVMQALSTKILNADLVQIPIAITDKGGAYMRYLQDLPDADKDALPDALEYALGTDPNVADTDRDSFSDAVEVENGYDPLAKGKRVAIGSTIVAKNVGRFVEAPNGYIWYVNAANNKRYWIANASASRDLARVFGLGISNKNLATIAVKTATLRADAPAAVKTTTTGPTNCGAITAPGANESPCWKAAFASCSPATITAEIDLGQALGGVIAMKYDILKMQAGKCLVKSQYTKNVNAYYLGKDMTCGLDNTKAFLDASMAEYQTGANCTGTLKPLLITGGPVEILH